MPSGTAKNAPYRISAGPKPTYSARRKRRRPPTASATGAESTGGAGAASVVMRLLRAEDVVERVDVRLLVAGRALDRHLQGALGLVVEEPPGAVAVALVHEQLVGLLVEQRPPVREEVLRDPGGLLGRVDELLEHVRVLGRLDHLLGVDEPDRALLRLCRDHRRAARDLAAVVRAE